MGKALGLFPEGERENERLWHPIWGSFVGQREETGLLEPVTVRHPCMVICDLWPGWAWALEGLSFEVTMIGFGSGAS
jgi:hypothetical protein